MALIHSPNVVRDGLVLSLDAGNVKSFSGPPQTNLLKGINYNISESNTQYLKVTTSSAQVDIPTIGPRTVLYVDIYNDYAGGSGSCCPSLFNFGTGTNFIPVTGNTTYTYSIIYKTATGYTHPNYMYRYELNGGTILTEAGVHSDSNRTHLGDGWYYAWGQFTTQATTEKVYAMLFHYEYATYNRVYVAAAQISEGTYISLPQQMVAPTTTRGTTVATGGGWADLSGNGNSGELVNGPTADSGSGGSIVFDGTNDYIDFSAGTLGNTVTVEMWVKLGTGYGGGMFFGWQNYDVYCPSGYIGYNTGNGDCYGISSSTVSSLGLVENWAHYVFEMRSDVAYTNNKIYINGTEQSLSQLLGTEASSNRNFNSGNGRIGVWKASADYCITMKCAKFSVYSKSLTANQVLQNFEATRGRFGV